MTALASSQIIHQTRSSLQLNMRKFASELGVSQNMISLWERGSSDVSDERLIQWKKDKREWVHQMAIQIITSRIVAFVEAC